MNNDCLFCKIGSKVIPSSVVYEDEQFLGFLDIQPVSKGHTLLIPKEHYVWMHETPDEVLAKIFITAKKLMNGMRVALSCDYVQISVVGKDVPHLHVHLIPRKFNDGLPQFPTIKYESDGEQDEMIEKIKNSLNSK